MKELLFDLQRFADNIAESNGTFTSYFHAGSLDTTDMARTTNVGSYYKNADNSAVTGDLAELSAEMKEYYSNYLIKDVGPNLVHAQFLDAETLPERHGRTIEWRKWSDFTKKTTPLTEGVTPEPSKISATPIRAKLNQYGDWSILSDLVQLQTVDDTLLEFTEKHSQNAKLTLDTITRGAMIQGCTNFCFAGGASTLQELSASFTPNDAARLTAYLRQNNAPTFDGSYVMIIHPFIAYDLMTNSNWIDVVKYSDATKIFKGELGKLYGIRFVESTEAKVTKAKVLATGSGATNGGTRLTVASYAVDGTSSKGTFTLAANTFTATEASALEGKLMLKHYTSTGFTVSEFTIDGATTGTVTATAATTPSASNVAAGDEIFDAASAGGKDYFTCLVLGKGAGRRVDFNGANAKMIINPVGSAGAADPMKQRGSVAWKVDGYAAAITNAAYIYKYYCVSSLDGAKAND